MRFAISTLGCKVNQYESQLIREALVRAGHTEQKFSESGAELYIVNTCTVTHRSDAEWRRLIRQALRRGGRVLVTGCGAVVSPKEITSLSNDLEVVGHGCLSRVLGVEVPSRITSFAGHARAFVQIQQGCSNFCAYCIVPYARGTPKSRPWEEIVAEVEGLVDAGYTEIVLTGINIGLYEGGLAWIIRKIMAHTSVSRIRLSSVEPWTVDTALIELITKETRVCDHIHLPLQSGSQKILEAMGRPYSTAQYASILDQIRTLSDSVSIGSDIMVGFPGEGEREFEESFSLVEKLPLTYLHVFPFSPRRGTRAFHMEGRQDPAAVRSRAARFRELSGRKKRTFMGLHIGTGQEVLVMKANASWFMGITSNYLNVSVKGCAEPGESVPVLITSLTDDSLEGELGG
ncbi:MAG: MiaB/RimO family radical SAM methylthiotransferase [Desulfomonilia bacterium]